MAEKKERNQKKVEFEEKKRHQKLVLERAKRIRALRREKEVEKAIEERKERLRKRAEAKQRGEKLRQEKAQARKASRKSKKDVFNEIERQEYSSEEFIELGVTHREYETLPTRKFLERKFWVNPSAYFIYSYIPGTIISVFAKEGKVVKEGKPLLILEAMKMQNFIEMPFEAKIKKVNVKEGEKIPKDFLMIELEPVVD
ncbi:MAG: hypothetical protein CR965_01055 [Paludibacter sp.]|nr:MAG: hypothetical protein CR965_01055 [Paludibacter sp.]